MDRKLASIQKVINIIPIVGADNIELATILGWNCVVKKGEFKVGDTCVYFEIDSQLPRLAVFDFMESRKYRVKTAKFMGNISQGMALPLRYFTEVFNVFNDKIKPINGKLVTIVEGLDVTEIIGVVKYDPEAVVENESISKKHNKYVKFMMKYSWFRKVYNTFFFKPKGSFPVDIPKTDENRVQNTPKISTIHHDKIFYVMEKLDGQSLTVFYNKKYKKWYHFKDLYSFGVCSRNNWLKTKTASNWWNVVDDYDIRNKLVRLCKMINKNIAIQLEIVGPYIQKNKYNLSKNQIFGFSIFDIDENRYLDYNDKLKYFSALGIPTVPMLYQFKMDRDIHDVDWFVSKSMMNSNINSNKLAEGIVCRCIDDDSISFKAINPEFLLKHKL